MSIVLGNPDTVICHLNCAIDYLESAQNKLSCFNISLSSSEVIDIVALSHNKAKLSKISGGVAGVKNDFSYCYNKLKESDNQNRDELKKIKTGATISGSVLGATLISSQRIFEWLDKFFPKSSSIIQDNGTVIDSEEKVVYTINRDIGTISPVIPENIGWIKTVVNPGELKAATEDFKQKNWEKMTPDEKDKAVEELIGYFKTVLGIKGNIEFKVDPNIKPGMAGAFTPPEKAENGGNDLGTITINPILIGDPTKLLYNIAHETRHAMQKEHIDSPRNLNDLLFKIATILYVTPNLTDNNYTDDLLYQCNYKEIDANNFERAIQSIYK